MPEYNCLAPSALPTDSTLGGVLLAPYVNLMINNDHLSNPGVLSNIHLLLDLLTCGPCLQYGKSRIRRTLDECIRQNCSIKITASSSPPNAHIDNSVEACCWDPECTPDFPFWFLASRSCNKSQGQPSWPYLIEPPQRRDASNDVREEPDGVSSWLTWDLVHCGKLQKI